MSETDTHNETQVEAQPGPHSPPRQEMPSGHTPGPWSFWTGQSRKPSGWCGDRDCVVVYATKGHEICEVNNNDEHLAAKANARLIASAPELLEAAKKTLDNLIADYGEPPILDDDWEMAHGDIAELRRVIAKAEGRTEGGVA